MSKQRLDFVKVSSGDELLDKFLDGISFVNFQARLLSSHRLVTKKVKTSDDRILFVDNNPFLVCVLLNQLKPLLFLR